MFTVSLKKIRMYNACIKISKHRVNTYHAKLDTMVLVAVVTLCSLNVFKKISMYNTRIEISKHRANTYHVKLDAMVLLCGYSVFTICLWKNSMYNTYIEISKHGVNTYHSHINFSHAWYPNWWFLPMLAHCIYCLLVQELKTRNDRFVYSVRWQSFDSSVW